jgi:hypothetical protein
MPAVPPFIREPLWEQFGAHLPQPQATHPLGCHRPRIPDQAVFDKLLQVPVFGRGYRRIADATCSATTSDAAVTSGSRSAWASGCTCWSWMPTTAMVGLELDDVAVDGCITKAPCGGQLAGRSPVDRGKQGLKRSVAARASRWPRCRRPPTGMTPRCWPRPWTRPWPP